MAAGNPLPATSPITRRSPPVAMGMILEEVAAHLLRGFVDAFDGEAGNGVDLLGKDDLLYFARGFEFPFELRLEAAGAAGTKHHDDGQGGGGEDARDIVD